MSRGPAAVVGVVGAGSMGSGIAQLAAQSGARTLVFDPQPGAAAGGVDRARAGIVKLAAKGRIAEAAEVVGARLEIVDGLDGLAGAQLILEAAPERLEVKRELFAQLSAIAPAAVLASNTSSIPITAIAGAAADPSRVVGMHFFNPAPLMALLEVVAGMESSADALALARATGEAMGKHVIDAADVAGFLVNRCSRPFSLEPLRLLQERIADVPTIDAIVRAAGFRMGPFEFADLVGTDTAMEVARSFHELSFGEPRWRPSPLAVQLVAAGRLGRKAGRGWYDYNNGPHRADDEPAPDGARGGDGRTVAFLGGLRIGSDLRARAEAAGFVIAGEEHAEPWLTVSCDAGAGVWPPPEGPWTILCAGGALAALDPTGEAAGFHALAPIGLVELTRSAGTTDVAAVRSAELFAALGLRTAEVADAPGLVLGRIVAQLINECAFALGEGVGSAQDIDAGMVLGLNHPRGPLAWADELGIDHVVAILDGLREEYGEERYRTAPLLRRVTSLHGVRAAATAAA
jgi:3-hydroxybutyryl-CoA dehydrogenase